VSSDDDESDFDGEIVIKSSKKKVESSKKKKKGIKRDRSESGISSRLRKGSYSSRKSSTV